MLEPKDKFYDAPELQALGVDWRTELAPHFAKAKRMLGVTQNPYRSQQDELLQRTATALGVDHTYGAVPNAICFSTDNQDDPYFDGEGPPRAACTRCGGCLTGCPDNAKNSLDKNYLYLAEQLGVSVLAETRADRIEPQAGGGYRVQARSTARGGDMQSLEAAHVVVASGVVGTLELLMKNRDEYQTLPALSPTLGKVVRTNSEAITGVLHPAGEDMTDGSAISSDFYADEHTHVTQNRFDHGYRIIRYLYGPMSDGTQPVLRALKTLFALFTSPLMMLRNWFCRDWEKRITFFTIMQDLDNSLGITYGRDWRRGFRRGLQSVRHPHHSPPTYLKVANDVTRVYARLAGGQPMSSLTESLGNRSTTAHILSGCPMGASVEQGAINTDHEVHGYPGLFVVDGSSIPANIGVNPSLTITAMAERFAEKRPPRTVTT